MTENVRKVAVNVTGQQRSVTIRSPAQGGQAAVNIDILPVRVIEAEEYRGEYTAIPEFDVQTFETKAKLMTDDFTVESIPVYDTSNPAGGVTIYIGGIFDG